MSRVTSQTWRERRDALAERIWRNLEASDGVDPYEMKSLVRAHQAITAHQAIIELEERGERLYPAGRESKS